MTFHIEDTRLQNVTMNTRGGVSQWVARLTRNGWMPVTREFEPHQRLTRCFLEQKTLPSLLSTGWFQEQIKLDLHKQKVLVSQLN